MNSENTDFNEVLTAQLLALVNSGGISNELKIVDKGFQITLLIERMEDE